MCPRRVGSVDCFTKTNEASLGHLDQGGMCPLQVKYPQVGSKKTKEIFGVIICVYLLALQRRYLR